MAVLFPIRVYQILVTVLCVALVLSFIHRVEYFDDAWFAEEAYWLMRTGHVRSELFRGLNGWENRLYVFHKLFIYTEALLLSVLGVTVAGSKVIGVLFGTAGIVLVWHYPEKAAREQRWLAVLLYLGCGTLIRYVCLNRPETMCMALGFASFFVLQRADTPRKQVVGAGILAGMSALTHLNGITYMMAGSVFILIRDGWRRATVFGIVSSLVLSLFVADALYDNQLPTLFAQFVHDPATKNGLTFATKLAVMAGYHEQFFHSENEAALSVLVLLCLLVFRRHLHSKRPTLLYTGLLTGAFWVVSKGVADIYFLLFLPWLAVLVAGLAVVYLPQQPRWQQQTGRWLVVGYLLLAGVQVGKVIAENNRLPNTEAQNARLAAFMPAHHTNVIAPLSFFFGQMEQYRIRGLTYYLMLSEKGPRLPLTTFFDMARRDRVLYIISDHQRNAAYDIPTDAPTRIGDYQRVYQDQWNSVYAWQPK